MQQNRPIGSFRQLTRQNSIPCNVISYAAFGGAAASVNVPRAGWLGKLFLYISGTLTSGSGTPSGSWPTYPALPYTLIGRIRVFTNTQTELCNMSGFGLYLYNRTLRYLADPVAVYNSAYNAGNNAALTQGPSGAIAASTAYPVNGWLEVPISTDDALFLGLLFLQSDQLTLTVEVTPPAQGDVIGAISGVSVTPAITIRPQAIFYDQPTDARIVPNTQYAHLIREDIKPISNTGDVQFALPYGNTYVKIAGMMENNSAQIAPGNINTVGLRYMQTVTPYLEDYRVHLTRNRAYFGEGLPDGMFLWDLSLGSGIPGLADSRDFINSSQVTDFVALTNLAAGLSLTSARCRLFTEQLAAIGGPA